MPYLWGGDISAEVPCGNYDVIFCFYNNSNEPYYVIKEQIDITEDVTISLSPDMATNHITIRNYGPDGNLLRANLEEIDESTGIITTSGGNVDKTKLQSMLFQRGDDEGPIRIYDYQSYGAMPSEEECLYPAGNIHVSDCSNKYYFFQWRGSYLSNDGFALSCFTTDNIKTQILDNKADKYVLHEETFNYSPYGKDKPGTGYGIGVITFYKGMWINRNQQYTMDTDPNTEKEGVEGNLRIWIADYEDSCNSGVEMAVAGGAIDYFKEQIVRPELPPQKVPVMLNGAWLTAVHGEKKSIAVPTKDAFDSALPTNDIYLFSHSEFTYPSDMKTGGYGNNCPINAINIRNYYAPWIEQNTTNLYNYFVGRYGETRWCDNPLITTELKFNGVTIENPDEWSAEADGIYDITVVDTNIEVDGLPGKNTTTVHYDLRQEDSTPPTIEMLQFKNSEGYITDRFEKAEDGTMIFTAADINYFMDPVSWEDNYSYKPVYITVEYSPYGEDYWTEMAIEEVPELYNENGWGYFYRASLENIDSKADNGWFDVRFSMADAAGNTHVQTVSPAFRINGQVNTGIKTPNIEHKQTTYDLQGRHVSNGRKGLTIVRSSNGDVHKMVVR